MTTLLTPAETMSSQDERSTQQPGELRSARLWVDGVGVWDLWMKDRLTIGGPGQPGSSRKLADLALLADLSRLHAEIVRTGESYQLSVAGNGSIGNRLIDGDVFLRSDDEITLGADVRLRFQIPSPLSRSAVVEILSGHRPEQRVDGVVMVEQACIIGPQKDHHIISHHAETQLVLFVRDDRLWCRSSEEWKLDESRHTGAACLEHGSVVDTDTLRFRIEYN